MFREMPLPFWDPMVSVTLKAYLPPHVMKNNEPLTIFFQNQKLCCHALVVLEREDNITGSFDVVISLF